jgi:hypothetical protein
MSFPTTSPLLTRALAERSYDRPTPVQIAVLATKLSTATFSFRPKQARARPSLTGLQLRGIF